LRQLLGVRTTAELFDRLGARRDTTIVLDALDTVQDPHIGGYDRISDLRLRHLLAFVARSAGPDVRIIVTSRSPPPPDLDSAEISLVGLCERKIEIALKCERGIGPPNLVEVLASSRRACSEKLLGWLAGSGASDSLVSSEGAVQRSLRESLKDLIVAGIVQPIRFADCDLLQMTDVARDHFLAGARASEVHLAIAAKLESEEARAYAGAAQRTDPELSHDLLERAIEHRLAAADVPNAILCYWTRMGNFSRLDAENALHVGARICRSLAGCAPPGEVPATFAQAPGAAAVLNDRATYALCLGDAKCAMDSALAANAMPTNDMRPWDRSTLARHVAIGSLIFGELTTAMDWANRARVYAREGLGLYQGVPFREAVDAYNQASYVVVRIATAGRDAAAANAIMTDLAAAHAHWRRKLEEYNRDSVVQVDGPTGSFDPEAMLDGRPAALAALLGGKAQEAVRILNAVLSRWSPERLSSRQGLDLRTMLLECNLAAGNMGEARAALPSLKSLAETIDDIEAQCRLAAAAAAPAIQDGNETQALACLDRALLQAECCALGLQRNELLHLRSNALLAAGRLEERTLPSGWLSLFHRQS
jgi:hypothetical protein